MDMPTQGEKARKYLPYIIIAALSIVYIASVDDALQFQGGDNAHYILLAKSIVSGTGYRDTFMPDAPYHTHYPPGFPLMLSVIVAIDGPNISAMKLFVAFCAVASFLLLYILLRYRSFAWPISVALWLAGSTVFFAIVNDVLSETPYMAFSLAALLAEEKWLKDKKPRHIALALVFTWVATLTRSAGMSLAFAIPLAYFLQSGFSVKSAAKSLGVAVLTMAPAVAWAVRNAMMGTGEGYLAQWLTVDPYDPSKGTVDIVGFIQRILENSYTYVSNGLGFIEPSASSFPTPLLVAVAILISASISIGMIAKARDDSKLLLIYTLCYGAVIMSWPFLGFRFLVPIYPLLMAFCIEGFHGIYKFISEKRGNLRKPLLVFWAAVFVAVLSLNFNSTFRYWKTSGELMNKGSFLNHDGIRFYAGNNYSYNLLVACKGIQDNTGKDDVIMARKPRLVALCTGRKVVGVPRELHMPVKQWLAEKGVRFIIVDEIYSNAGAFVKSLARGRNSIPGVKSVYRVGETQVMWLSPEFYEDSSN